MQGLTRGPSLLPPIAPCVPQEGQRAEMESGEGGGPMVTDQDIANIVAQWTGIPIEKVRAGTGGLGGL